MLYNTYRPQSFDDVVGQETAISTIRAAITKDRLSHSILINGMHGTGKTTLARLIAKETKCLDCDIFEIDAASNNSVEDARNLIKTTRVHPTGKVKTYIIDEAHMYSSQAFNALLKVIEEPPSYCRFILCTTEKHKIIATIQSRCQLFDLKKIEGSDVVDRLKFICVTEGINFEEEALITIARQSNGSLRDAISLLEMCRENCSTSELFDKLNMVSQLAYFNLVTAMKDAEVDKSLLILDKLLRSIEVDKFCLGFTEFLRDLFYFKSAATETLIFMSDSLKKEMRLLYKGLGPSLIFGMLDNISKILYDVNESTLKNQSIRLGLEILIIKINLNRKKQLTKRK